MGTELLRLGHLVIGSLVGNAAGIWGCDPGHSWALSFQDLLLRWAELSVVSVVSQE